MNKFSGTTVDFKAILATLITVLIALPVCAQDEKLDVGDLSHDGLTITESTKRTIVQVREGVDWSVYGKFIILDSHVALKENWQRNYNRNSSGVSGRVSDSQVAKIKQGVGDLLNEAFTKTFIEKGDFVQVTEADATTLLLRPAIINLDVYAPDVASAGRSTTYVRSAGNATLYLEIYDAVSGAILARWMDYEEATDYGYARWASRSSNTVEAKRIISSWTQRLEEGFERTRSGEKVE